MKRKLLTSAALLTRPVVVPSSDTAYSPSMCFSLEKSRIKRTYRVFHLLLHHVWVDLDFDIPVSAQFCLG